MSTTKFPWGRVLREFTIDFDGQLMSVTKFHPWVYRNCNSTGKPDPNTIHYHCEEIGRSDSSLQRLIIAWMATQNLGLNQYALVEGISRALDIK